MKNSYSGKEWNLTVIKKEQGGIHIRYNLFFGQDTYMNGFLCFSNDAYAVFSKNFTIW